MVCKRSRLGTALLRIAMPAPAFYAVVTMLFTAQFVGLAGQAVAAEFIGVAAAMRGDVIRVPGVANRIGTAWSQVQPRWLVRKLGGFVARQLFSGR